MILEAKDVSFAFSNQGFALKSISLQITEHSLTAIMGLNGSGKSTLLNILSGLILPTHGQVFLNNKPITDFTHLHLAQTLSVVPQDFPTVFPYTVFEFVMMGLYPWKTNFYDSSTDEKFIFSILEDMQLESFCHRQLNTLSGGERQRVLLARALAQKTPLILLDEPLNHLDIKHKYLFLKKLKSLSREHKKTVIAVMHDLNEVNKTFDSVIFLKSGNLHSHNPTRNLDASQILTSVFDLTVDL